MGLGEAWRGTRDWAREKDHGERVRERCREMTKEMGWGKGEGNGSRKVANGSQQ